MTHPGSPAHADVRLAARRLSTPVLAIHGGAGRLDGRGTEAEAGLRAALDAGWAVLDAGGPALDAAVAAVASMEDSGVFNAGRGAVPTTAGAVETDAAVMGVLAGGREVSGAACAVTWPANPVLLAREIAVAGGALLLAGPGGDAFASAAGLRRRDPSPSGGGGGGGGGFGDGGGEGGGRGEGGGGGGGGGGRAPVSTMGTVGAVALDRAGALAAATSTGGRAGQPPGRVGDTPILGAGTWADQGRVAVSATGEGEAFVRAGFAHRVDWAVGAGVAVEEAAVGALGCVGRWGGRGGAVVLGAGGELVALYDTEAMAWGWRSGEETVAEVARRG
ncbi:MAG: isoaspartyl peptidase/L-asparaginase [Acidimicrobiales bacterium]